MKNIYTLVVALMCMSTASFSQINSTVTGGNWSDPATWEGAAVPTSTDNVTIVDGSVVVIDIDASALNLTVGQGTSGILQFEPLVARTLTVGGDVAVLAGGIFRSAQSGTQTDHLLSVGANLTNNGILNFSTNGNTAAAEIRFTGAANAAFTGSGVTTDVSAITIDKGTSAASVLELNTTVFTFQGATSTPGAVQSFLDIINGTFKISGTFTMDNGLFIGTGNYTIPPSGGLWLNNPNFTVNARTGTAYVEGTLQVDAGTLNVGDAPNNRLGYILGSVITINGGAINVASRFSATTTYGLTYLQTGGVFTVNTVGSTSAGFASFDLRDNDNASFTMSGGTIVIQNPGIGGAGPRDYINDATIRNITGGTIQVGNALTTPGGTFFLAGYTPDLVIDNASAGLTARLFGNLTVLGNTTINPGTTLNLEDDLAAGHTFLQVGDTLTNAGTLTGSAVGSLLSFSGLSAQTYRGDGIFTSAFAQLQINNASGLSITNLIPSEINTLQLSMLAGDISAGVSTISLGTGTASLGVLNYTSGTVIGKFKRWIGAASGNTDFPVGIAGATRTASIDYTSAPTTGGTLTAEWISANPGTNGLPLNEPGYPPVTDVAPEGYWTMVAADGLVDGVYTGTFTATNVVSVIDFNELVLIKRANNAAPWTLDGTHVMTTGSNTTPILSRTGMTGFSSDFAIGGSITSLPVTIEYFRGSKKSNGNLLDWKISCTNSPTATMSLERGTDGRKFESINNITATAVRCLQPFSYSDVSPNAGINYYRIKVTDADGKSTYSNIIALLNKAAGFDLISMMPNPVSQLTTLSIASAVDTKMNILVTDISGKKVAVRSITLVAGSNQVSLDFSSLASGNYQLTAYSAEGSAQTLRFIKN